MITTSPMVVTMMKGIGGRQRKTKGNERGGSCGYEREDVDAAGKGK